MTNYFREEDAIDLQSEYRLAGRPFKHVVSRLDSLLMVLKSCYAKECHEPWQTIHPKSKIKTLKHALDQDFDAFYEAQPKVSFSSCELGYLKDAEGPQHVNSWEGFDGTPKSFRYQGPNSWWT